MGSGDLHRVLCAVKVEDGLHLPIEGLQMHASHAAGGAEMISAYFVK
ncbi:hypothetical protein [Polyangium mundeleinium]|uniref:Uncharacterized protein n=1 Tax=Polyangium mundeleinium TaxID=2995306 RepID=A0ABT5EW62_9BACT|nr:hypothetical protein [Polyangium mundeleinium]MDC0746059.1 hypothetical protein [Polyangium mundeleinium]